MSDFPYCQHSIMGASDKIIRLKSARNSRADMSLTHAARLPVSLLGTSAEEREHIWTALGRECQEGIMVCDAKERVVFVNAAFENITGYKAAEVTGQTPRILHSGQQDQAFYTRMWTAIQDTGRWHGEICNRRKDGSLYMQWLSLAAVTNRCGEITHYVAVFTDLSRRTLAQDRVRRLVSLDELTQLPNRSSLAERLEELLLATSTGKTGLMFIDLDRFKNINDSLGHEAGDLLLQVIGNRLRSLVRRSDFVARTGGDEFAVVLPNIATRADLGLIADKVLAEISQPLMLGDREVVVSGTIGLCLFPDDASGASELMRNAGTALYEAKRSGRNMSRFYVRAMSEHARETLAIETGLRHALKRHEFELYYQPQLDLRSGEIRSAEALIRWNRPEIGVVLPGDFIPLAEERGLITDIGTWTIGAATRQIACWSTAALPELAVAINLSATQFHRGGLLSRVEQALREAGVAPERIELEITEGVIVEDAEATIALLQALRQLGVLISIDDFGTGYSSLSYLKRFPIQRIKIDKSFVNEMTSDAGSAGIVRGIIELARSLRLEVVAEGVETAEQLTRLRELGCDRAQGYLIGRPLPAAQFERLVRGWVPANWKR